MEGVSGVISQGPGRAIFIILIGIVLIFFLYNVYRWVNIGSDYKDYILYTSPATGLPGKDLAATKYTSGNVPGIYPGGEVSVSTWIYVTNWSINNSKNKVFLTVSGGGPPASGFNTLVMYLGTSTNKLGVRVSYDDPSMSGSTSTTLDYVKEMPKLIAGTSPYSDTTVGISHKNGDIDNIALQKWVSITTVLAGRTLDVYIDGKLSRSTVLPGMYKVDSDIPTVILGGPNGFGGLIGETRVANFAYSPDQVYKNYLSGPFDNSILGALWGYINPGQYSIDIKKTG